MATKVTGFKLQFADQKIVKPQDTEERLRACPIPSCNGAIVRLTIWRYEYDPHGPIGPSSGQLVSNVEIYCSQCKALFRE